MGPVEAVKTCFRKYGTFDGRARRSEYWWFYLFRLIVILVPVIVGFSLTSSARSGLEDGGAGSGMDGEGPLILFIGFAGLLYLATLVPAFAVTARRIHDTGQSGWWQLIVLIPNVGSLALIIWCCMPGTAGDNKYGTLATVEDVFT